MIRQGEIYRLESPGGGSALAVVVQNNLFNQSLLPTVVVCEIGEGAELAEVPGNVVLDEGEEGESAPSVVNVGRLLTVAKSSLGQPVGELTPVGMVAVLAGVSLMVEPREAG